MPTIEFLNYEVLDDHGWEVTDSNLFEKASEEALADEDHGSFELGSDEWILSQAKESGYKWPFSCKAGACANCAAIVREGEVNMHSLQQILSREEVESRDIRLTCIATPETETIKLIYNAKYIGYLRNRVVRS